MFSHLTESLRRLSIRGRAPEGRKPLVTVFGATGAQGSSVASALMESGRYRVRGFTRNAESERARKLKAGGVEVVQGDLGHKEDLSKALEGAYAAFVVTDFWTVREREFDMGRLAVECAKEAGVKHLIWSTLPDTVALSDGEINVPHFVGKAKVDRVVEQQGFEHHTFMMCSFYFQNFAQFGFTALEEGGEAKARTGAGEGGAGEGAGKGKGKAMSGTEEAVGTVEKVMEEEGVKEEGKGTGEGKAGGAVVGGSQEKEEGGQGTVVFKLPLGAEDMLTAFDVDDTGYAVLSILDNPSKWNGKRVCLAGFHAPAAEYATVFQEVKKKPTRYERIPADNEEFAEMFKWFSTKTLFGPYDITNGRECYPGLKSWDEWLQQSAWDGPHAAPSSSVEKGRQKIST